MATTFNQIIEEWAKELGFIAKPRNNYFLFCVHRCDEEIMVGNADRYVF